MHTIPATGGNPNFWESVWRWLELRPVVSLVILYFLCVVLFLVSIPLPRVDGQLTGSDGAFYYSYLPTLLLDHDLDFTNQYAALVPANVIARLPLTADGRPTNSHPIGTAVLWAPFFLIGHCIALVLKILGYQIQLDGLGYVYQIPTLLGSITYGFAGILLVYYSCRRFFNAAASVSAAILICLATNVIYYLILEPSMSHSCSFFAAALFMNLWLSYRPHPTLKQWLLLGISGGIIALVRQPDAAWFALPVIDSLLAMKTDWHSRLRGLVKGIVVYGMAAAITFIPQLILWHMLQGSAIPGGHMYPGSPFGWITPHVLAVLFSLRHGLFSWHPVLLFAVAGLLMLYRKERSLILSFGLLAAMQVYIVGAWYGWFGGDSFGCRMLIGLLPILALGFAAQIQWAVARRAIGTVFLLALCSLVWNGLFIIQYRMGFISRIRPITFYELTVGKVVMLREIPARLHALLR